MSLQFGILGILNYKSATGYELKAAIDCSINHFWSANLSQIYRDLGTLEEKGYATSVIEPQEGRPDKKVYSITEAGKSAFKDWVTKFPPSLSFTLRDEFLMRIFFGAAIDPKEVIFQLQKFIKEKEDEIASLTKLETTGCKPFNFPFTEDDQYFWQLTKKMGFATAEVSINWARECIKDIEARYLNK